MSGTAGSSLAALRTGVRLDVGPFQIWVRSDLPQVAHYIDRLYVDFPKSSEPGGHFDVWVTATQGWRRWLRPQANLTVNGNRPFLPLPADVAGAMMEWGINWCVGTYAHRWLIVHSAVVERDGLGLLLTNESGAGKSTLCAALLFDGWRLLSDEFAIVEPETLRLRAAPRPISLKNRSIEVVAQRGGSAAEFGPEGIDVDGDRFVHMRPPAESVRRVSEPARPRWIIVPRYVEGSPTLLEPIEKASMLVHISDQSFNYNLLGPAGFECLAQVVEACDCFSLEYSDLDDALRRLRQLEGLAK